MTLKRVCTLLPVLALFGTAHAGTVAVTPLVDVGAGEKPVIAVHQLLTSELDFQPSVDGLVDVDPRPTSVTRNCLNSASCLRGVTTTAETDMLVTGTLGASGSELALDLLLYDAASNSIVRRKTWVVPADNTALANSITPIISELLTGVDPNAAQEDTVTASDFDSSDEEDDFAFEEEDPEVAALLDDDFIDEISAPPAPVVPVPVPVPAPAPAPVPVPAPAVDASAISFGGSADQISTEDVDQLIQFGAPSTPPPLNAAPAPTQSAMTTPAPQQSAMTAPQQSAMTAPQQSAMTASRQSNANAASQVAADAIMDLDSPTRDPAEGPDESVNLSLRGGYSKYYEFDFFTGGGELGLRLGPTPLYVVAGVEAYLVQRNLPPEIQIATGQIYEWNAIYPMNIGMLYRFGSGNVRPYIGADAIMAQYYRDAIGSDWAGGARARTGLDYFFNSTFGVNVNVAVGAWVGQNWPYIEPGVEASGMLPQASAGAILAF